MKDCCNFGKRGLQIGSIVEAEDLGRHIVGICNRVHAGLVATGQTKIDAAVAGQGDDQLGRVAGGAVNQNFWVSTSLSYPLHLVSEAAMTAD